MFTLFLYREAAGLNLYYATQNLATLPQQWHLSRTRGMTKPKVAAPAKEVVTAPAKGKAKGKG